jgi:hypothetical protein
MVQRRAVLPDRRRDRSADRAERDPYKVRQTGSRRIFSAGRTG